MFCRRELPFMYEIRLHRLSLLAIRPLKTVRVTIEDTQRIVSEKRNLFLQKSVQVQGYSKYEEQAHFYSLFLFLTQWALPLSSDLLSFCAQSAHNWLMLHLESGNGVSCNFCTNMELSEQELKTRTQNCKQLRWWHTLTEKTTSLTVPPSFYFSFFSSNLLNIIWLSISAVLNNWHDMGVYLVRVVSMSLRINPCIQGVTQHPIKAFAPNITMREIKIEVIPSTFQTIILIS
jgi:hypothetical protein